MTLTALLAMIVMALIALPVIALAAMMWNAIPTAGFGDIFPDERLLKAISGGDVPAQAEQQLWT